MIDLQSGIGRKISGHTPDPQRVITPLVPDQAEELLRKYGIIDTWHHIIVGLQEGFDVGIQEQLSRSYIFQQSQFIPIRSRLHHFIYIW